MTDKTPTKPDEAAAAAEAARIAAETEAAAAAEAARIAAETEAAAAAEAARIAAETEAAAAAAARATPAVPAIPDDVQKAATKRAAAAKGGASTEAERMIAALQAERLGYVQRGLTARVEAVDASIAAWKKKGKA